MLPRNSHYSSKYNGLPANVHPSSKAEDPGPRFAYIWGAEVFE